MDDGAMTRDFAQGAPLCGGRWMLRAPHRKAARARCDQPRTMHLKTLKWGLHWGGCGPMSGVDKSF